MWGTALPSTPPIFKHQGLIQRSKSHKWLSKIKKESANIHSNILEPLLTSLSPSPKVGMMLNSGALKHRDPSHWKNRFSKPPSRSNFFTAQGQVYSHNVTGRVGSAPEQLGQKGSGCP